MRLYYETAALPIQALCTMTIVLRPPSWLLELQAAFYHAVCSGQSWVGPDANALFVARMLVSFLLWPQNRSKEMSTPLQSTNI